jgi:hypothetical protein
MNGFTCLPVYKMSYWYRGAGPAKQGRRAPTSVAELGGAIGFALIFFVSFLYQDKKDKKDLKELLYLTYM